MAVSAEDLKKMEERLVTSMAAAVAAQLAVAQTGFEATVGRRSIRHMCPDARMQMLVNVVEFMAALALSSQNIAQDLRRFETILHNVLMEGTSAGRSCSSDMECIIQQLSSQWPALATTASGMRISRDPPRRQREDDREDRGGERRQRPRGGPRRSIEHDGVYCRHCSNGGPASTCWKLHPHLAKS